MKRIVVGADGSTDAASATRWAAELAAPHEAELVVMTGFEPSPGASPEEVETQFDEQQRELSTWSEAAELDGVVVRSVVEQGDPRPGILEVAEREEADLIVVGRMGRSAGPGIFHTGSMAEWLAHNTKRPLAIVGGKVSPTTRSVLVGVDGSPGSRAAVRWLRDKLGLADRAVIAAEVEQPFVEWTPPHSPKNWRRRVEQRIRDDFAADLTAAGIDFRPVAVRGSNAAHALLEAAEEERVDVIVVGLRGLGGFTGLRAGGVALKTLHRADRPVILVPEE